MLRSCLPLLAAILLISSAHTVADEAPKTTTVKLKKLTLKVPADWKKGGRRNSMRLATFEIPAAKEDGGVGELAIFNFPGGGGPVDQNISRWIGQFESKGRQSKVTVGKAGDAPYHPVEVSGTYNQSVGPPIRRQTKAVPNSRMLAVILTQASDVYFLKMTGPDETVKAQANAFRKSFGGDAASEKEQE